MATKKTDTPEINLDQMRKDYSKALAEALKARMSSHRVESTVKMYADEAVAAAIGEEIGLKRNTWGDWEVSLKAHSPISLMLKDAARAYFTTHLQPIIEKSFGGLTDADKRSLMKKYRDELKESVSELLTEYAREQAKIVVQDFTKTL